MYLLSISSSVTDEREVTKEGLVLRSYYTIGPNGLKIGTEEGQTALFPIALYVTSSQRHVRTECKEA